MSETGKKPTIFMSAKHKEKNVKTSITDEIESI